MGNGAKFHNLTILDNTVVDDLNPMTETFCSTNIHRFSDMHRIIRPGRFTGVNCEAEPRLADEPTSGHVVPRWVSCFGSGQIEGGHAVTSFRNRSSARWLSDSPFSVAETPTGTSVGRLSCCSRASRSSSSARSLMWARTWLTNAR